MLFYNPTIVSNHSENDINRCKFNLLVVRIIKETSQQ
jgi:hypothetical protein